MQHKLLDNEKANENQELVRRRGENGSYFIIV